MAKEKIVVIDDSPIVRKLAELALEEEGYKVYTAEDGEEGLRISEEVLPSVILVDFIMPRISGYQFCKSARENELLKDIPIILITGKGEDVGKKFAEKFGVVDYFIKPFKSEMLVDKVNSIINAQRQRVDLELPVFDSPQTGLTETDEFAYQVDAPSVESSGHAAAAETAEMVEVPEIPANFVADIEVPAAIEEVSSGDKETEAVPVLSFDDIATLEEPQPFLQTDTEEVAANISSFDFNLEDLSTQQIVTEGEEIPSEIPDMSDTTAEMPASLAETFDFGSVAEFKGIAAVEDEMAPVSSDVTETTAASGPAVAEQAIEQIFRRYFVDELPMLIEQRIEDVLKRHGLIKPSTILFSATLREIPAVEMLRLISSSHLTGKFLAFSSAGSVEVYFDKGLVAYAVTSKHIRPAAQRPGLSYDTGEKPGELVSEALLMVSDFRDGGTFFEKVELPFAVMDSSFRMNFSEVAALIDEGRA